MNRTKDRKLFFIAFKILNYNNIILTFVSFKENEGYYYILGQWPNIKMKQIKFLIVLHFYVLLDIL